MEGSSILGFLQYIDTTSVLLFTLVFLFCYWALRPRKNLPPSPFGFPIIGNVSWALGATGGKLRPAEFFMREGKKIGNVIYYKIMNQGFLAVTGYDAINELFVKNAASTSDRPDWINPVLKTALKEGKGLLWQSGEDWKKIRKFTLQSMKEFGVGKTSLESKIFDEIEAISEVFRKTSGQPFDVRHHMGLMIANVIYGIVFGRRWEYTDEKFNEILGVLDAMFQRNSTSGGLFFQRLPKFILKLAGIDGEKELKRREKLINYIKNHIINEIKEHEETFDEEMVRDFIDIYIQHQRTGEDKHLFSVGNVFRVIIDLFLAGSETTSNTIIWSILFMSEYPDVQKKCQDEINEKYGSQEIHWSNRGTLPYIEATLLEIQRLANVAEMSLPHTNSEEFTFQGYTIPKHTVMQAVLMSSNMDPKQFEEPEKFNPDRFLENGKLRKNPAFMPFSTGPRVCAGENLAKMEMFLIFTNFLQKFTFHREDDSVPHSFGKIKNQLTSSPLPFKVMISPRS